MFMVSMNFHGLDKALWTKSTFNTLYIAITIYHNIYYIDPLYNSYPFSRTHFHASVISFSMYVLTLTDRIVRKEQEAVTIHTEYQTLQEVKNLKYLESVIPYNWKV